MTTTAKPRPTVLEASKATFSKVTSYGQLIEYAETTRGIVFVFVPRLTWKDHTIGVGIWRPQNCKKLQSSQATAQHLQYFGTVGEAAKVYEDYCKGKLPKAYNAHHREHEAVL